MIAQLYAAVLAVVVVETHLFLGNSVHEARLPTLQKAHDVTVAQDVLSGLKPGRRIAGPAVYRSWCRFDSCHGTGWCTSRTGLYDRVDPNRIVRCRDAVGTSDVSLFYDFVDRRIDAH